MAQLSSLRFSARTDEEVSLLRIINMVRLGEATTRPEIGRLTGLGRGVVTQRVEQAIGMGYLEDGEIGASTGGRAPRTLRFRGDRGLIAVCALGAMHIHVGLAHLSGDLVGDAHQNWDISRGPAETLDVVMAMLDGLIEETARTPIWGIAVGVPGPVDFGSGRPVAPPIMPGWNGFDLRRRFETRYEAPTWVDNDVNLLAFAEKAARRQEKPDLIYCKVGTGVGAGLLSRGRIHRGLNGAAGDIGHLRFGASEEVCRCGKVGCLEAVAGGWALVRDAEAAVRGGRPGLSADWLADDVALTPEVIANAAENGDAFAITLVQRSARVVGEALATLVNLFNPGVIVIGGAMVSAGEIYLAEIRQRVYEIATPLATRDLSIVSSFDDPREPLRGGVDMVREQLFDHTFVQWFDAGRPSPGGGHASSAK